MNKMWNTMMALPSVKKSKPIKKTAKELQRERAQQHSIELNKIGFNFCNHFDGTYSLHMWRKADDIRNSPFQAVDFKNIKEAEGYIKKNYETLKAYGRTKP